MQIITAVYAATNVSMDALPSAVAEPRESFLRLSMCCCSRIGSEYAVASNLSSCDRSPSGNALRTTDNVRVIIVMTNSTSEIRGFQLSNAHDKEIVYHSTDERDPKQSRNYNNSVGQPAKDA
jgi:hypothetical protein